MTPREERGLVIAATCRLNHEAGFPVPPAEVNMSVLVRAITYPALFIACRQLPPPTRL